MNIFKKICDKLFPGYKETEQESKVRIIITELLSDPMTNKILYDSYSGYFSNTEKHMAIAIEDRRITIMNENECYCMDCTAKFSMYIEDILRDSVRKTVSEMIQKSENIKNNLLDTMLTEVEAKPTVHYE